MSSEAPLVFIVDDDGGVRAAMQRLLKSVGLRSEAFAAAQDFLQRTPHDGPGCLILACDFLELAASSFNAN